MAIVIEEERNRTSSLGFLTWGIVLAIIAVSVYYIFFRRPAGTSVEIPQNLKDTQSVSELRFDSTALVNHPSFRARQDHVSPPTPSSLGRDNPFAPF